MTIFPTEILVNKKIRRRHSNAYVCSSYSSIISTHRHPAQPSSWHSCLSCLLDDLKAFDATCEGSTKHSKLCFGVEAEVRTVAAKAGKWYRGVLEATECFMTKWHDIVAALGRNRHASTTYEWSSRELERGGNSLRETAVDESRKDMADMVAMYQAD